MEATCINRYVARCKSFSGITKREERFGRRTSHLGVRPAEGHLNRGISIRDRKGRSVVRDRTVDVAGSPGILRLCTEAARIPLPLHLLHERRQPEGEA